MLKQTTYLLDVRTADEFARQHLEGALHHDLRRMELGEFPALPLDAHIEVYCASGARSTRAVELMGACGFEDVTNLGGVVHH
jgi:rhodanese-related sulfurtransferase